MRRVGRSIRLLLIPALLTACVGSGGPSRDPASRPRPTDSGATPVSNFTSSAPAVAKARVRFQDVLEEAGLGRLPGSGPTYGSVFADADLDGWPDLVVGRHKRHPRFFLNRKGRFEFVSAPGLQKPAPGRSLYDLHSCNWGEADGDGRPDLYCVSGAQDGQGAGPNRLFVQRWQGPSLSLATPSSLKDRRGRGRTASWLDIDGDGDLDLFVANEIRAGAPSVLYENKKSGWRAVAGSPLSSRFPARSASWADWNNDGDPDVMVLGHGFRATRTFEGRPGRSFREVKIDGIAGEEWLSASFGDYDNDGWNDVALVSERRSAIFRNDRGNYEPAIDLPVRAGRMAVWADVDNDGLLDLFLVQGAVGDPPRAGAPNHPNVLFMQQKDHGFRKVADAGVRGPVAGNSGSVAAADFDRDGRIDLFVGHGYLDVRGPFQLLRNTSRTSNNYLSIHLHGPPENPFGFGASIEASAGDMTIRRATTDGFTFRSQSSPGIVHVGVGSAEVGDVLVTWPGGKISCARSPANRIVKMSFRDARRNDCARV